MSLVFLSKSNGNGKMPTYAKRAPIADLSKLHSDKR